jgi:hypothetical protein
MTVREGDVDPTVSVSEGEHSGVVLLAVVGPMNWSAPP